MATRQRRSRAEVLDAQIEKLKTRIEADQSKLKDLEDERASIKQDEIVRMIEESGKSLDEIEALLQS